MYLILSQTTNFRLFLSEKVCRRQFQKSGKFFTWVENTVGKGEIAQLLYSVFKIPVLQIHKKQGLFGKGLTLYQRTKNLDRSKLKELTDDN